jgi:hypothetical protein
MLAPIFPDSKSVAEIALKSEPLQAVVKNQLPYSSWANSGELLFPEDLIPSTYKRKRYGDSQIMYNGKLNGKYLRQIQYYYENGTKCKIDKKIYESITCYPNKSPGECYRDTRAPERYAGGYYPPTYLINDAGSCVTISFRDDTFSPAQMIQIVNALERVK